MALPQEENYTFADMLKWPDSGSAELIDGEIFDMTPPSRIHQQIVGELFRQISNFLDEKPCQVCAAPFAVRLFQQKQDTSYDVNTVVEPDLSVVCDHDKLDEYGCKGAPDMVIEVLSPSTQRHDRLVKLNLYQKAGVSEYWIVNPQDQTAQVFLLTDGLLLPHEIYDKNDTAVVNVLSGCSVELRKVFQN